MKFFSKNQDLEPGTVVYFHENHNLSDPITEGKIHGVYEYEDTFVTYYLVEVEVPVIGATYLTLRTNMNIYLRKEDVPTVESVFNFS